MVRNRLRLKMLQALQPGAANHPIPLPEQKQAQVALAPRKAVVPPLPPVPGLDKAPVRQTRLQQILLQKPKRIHLRKWRSRRLPPVAEKRHLQKKPGQILPMKPINKRLPRRKARPLDQMENPKFL